MKTVLALFLLFESIALGDGKPPEYWCRVESETQQGEFLNFAKTMEMACASAMKECALTYDDCFVESYGEW